MTIPYVEFWLCTLTHQSPQPNSKCSYVIGPEDAFHSFDQNLYISVEIGELPTFVIEALLPDSVAPEIKVGGVAVSLPYTFHHGGEFQIGDTTYTLKAEKIRYQRQAQAKLAASLPVNAYALVDENGQPVKVDGLTAYLTAKTIVIVGMLVHVQKTAYRVISLCDKTVTIKPTEEVGNTIPAEEV